MGLIIPLAWVGSEFEYGNYVHYQPLIIVAVILLGIIALNRMRIQRRRFGCPSLSLYIVTLLTTDLLSTRMQIDHSHDYPIDRAIENIRLEENLSRDEIVSPLGPATAEGRFQADSKSLPLYMGDKMREEHVNEAMVLAYHETAKFNGESTQYLFFDPSTRRYLFSTRCSGPFNRSAFGQTNWLLTPLR